MANPNPSPATRFGPNRPSLGGLTKAQAELRDLSRTLLLTEERRDLWLAAYDKALATGDTAIILDFAYRLLGKPKDAPQATTRSGQLSGQQISEGLARVDMLLKKLEETH